MHPAAMRSLSGAARLAALPNPDAALRTQGALPRPGPVAAAPLTSGPGGR
jgi:hypothetical protein